jgi:hypothetical protein
MWEVPDTLHDFRTNVGNSIDSFGLVLSCEIRNNSHNFRLHIQSRKCTDGVGGSGYWILYFVL